MSCYYKTVKQQKQWPFNKNFKFVWKNEALEKIIWINQQKGNIRYIRKIHSKKPLQVLV